MLADGSSRVFGIQLEESTVAETLSTLGEDHELAIISDQNDRSGLEIYYSHFSAGPIKGKLIIAVTAAQETLEKMQARANSSSYTASGSRKFLITAEDLHQIQHWPVNNIAFIPSASLDEDIIKARFGQADQVVSISEDETHFLYPHKGLDITLNANGKEVLQYVAPRSFSRLAEPLLQPQTKQSEAQK